MATTVSALASLRGHPGASYSFRPMGLRPHSMALFNLITLRNLYAGQEATVRTGHGTTAGSKLGKESVKAVYCHPAYLTSLQSTS